jgi:signal transduction histidine kinase
LADKPLSILLVEDNPGDRRLICEMLAEARSVTFDIKHADRLQAGLEYLGENRADVVLLDLGLPDSQGLETLSKMYAQVSEVPIVVLTGLDDEMTGVQAINKGAQDYLIKGQVDTNLLARTIRYAIERQQADERERQLHLQLDLSNRLASLGVMVEGIAHEINNPLVSVTGIAELLMEEDIPESAKESVKTIIDSGQRIANIVTGLSAFAQQQELKRTYVNINNIIQDTLAMRAYSMETSSIEVTTQFDPALPLTMADTDQLQQVFLNIIINAETGMKLAHGKGSLSVKTETIENTIKISFTDDGPGIPEANLIHLFDPFFSTREVSQGIGLGLSVCYGIITGHNGQIYVRSRLGKGAIFIIELPVIAEEKDVEVA